MVCFRFKLSLCLVTLLCAKMVVTICPPEWESHTFEGKESCYRVFEFQQHPKEWQDAETFCENSEDDAHLVYIGSIDEAKKVYEIFENFNPKPTNNDFIWTGLREATTGDEFRWSKDESLLVYEGWGNEPQPPPANRAAVFKFTEPQLEDPPKLEAVPQSNNIKYLMCKKDVE